MSSRLKTHDACCLTQSEHQMMRSYESFSVFTNPDIYVRRSIEKEQKVEL